MVAAGFQGSLKSFKQSRWQGNDAIQQRYLQLPSLQRDFGQLLLHRKRSLPPLNNAMREKLDILSDAGVSHAHRIARMPMDGSDKEKAPLSNGVSKEEWQQIFRPAGAVSTGGQLEADLAVRFLTALALGSEDVFLDLGSSVGTLCLLAGLVAPGCRVIGVELSPSRVHQARRMLQQLRAVLPASQNSFQRVDFCQGDFNATDFVDGSIRQACEEATVVYCAAQYLSLFDVATGGTSPSRFLTKLAPLRHFQRGTRLFSLAVLSPELFSSSAQTLHSRKSGSRHLELLGAYDMEGAYGLKHRHGLRIALEYRIC